MTLIINSVKLLLIVISNVISNFFFFLQAVTPKGSEKIIIEAFF